ncbi:MAG: AfsR/SARP family transcriptional regulator, partial [Nakamurella sp.]
VELDGLPLALELAAARMRVLSAAQLADGLRDRFALLSGGNRGMAAHQQDLAQLVEWSCRSLDPAELALFRVLAVFANGFDLDGAAAVSAGSPSATLPLLNGLLRRSLLSAIPASTPRRYRMLETVRQWAITHSSTAERAQAEALHRTYILQRAQLAEAEIRGPSSDIAIARLRLDGPEHRVVFASTDRESALALAGALGWFWYRIGAIEEGLRHTRRALGITETHWNEVDLVGEVANDEARLRRAAALIGLGGLTYLSGEPAAAAAALDAAGRLAAQADDPPAAARATAWRAHMLSFTNTPAQAVEQAQQSMTMARQAGVDWVTAEAMMILGMALRSARRPADNTGVAYDDDDGPRPRVVLAEAVSIAERAGHRWAATSSTWALMKAAMDDGDYAAALAAAGRMQDALESDGDVTSWLVLVHSTAAALAATGSADAAARLLGAVRTLGAGIGFDPGRMDPVDGPREVQAVRDALSAADFDRQVAVGAAMNRAEVTLELRELLQRTIKP